MEENKIEGFVKYNHFDKEQKKQKEDKNPFATEKLYFNPSQDCYYCPMGQKMEKLGEAERLNSEQIH